MYLTNDQNVHTVLEVTQISLEELESYVGRFKPTHWRFPGLLRGEAVLHANKLVIRHHFTKKTIITFDL